MAFTFTTTAAAGTSAPAGATSGGVTPWFRIYERIAPSSFIIAGTFVATIQIEYSNNQSFNKGTPEAIDPLPITAPTLRAYPLCIADFVRYRCTAFTSGAPTLSHAKALDAHWHPFDIPEDTNKTPPPSSLGGS